MIEIDAQWQKQKGECWKGVLFVIIDWNIVAILLNE